MNMSSSEHSSELEREQGLIVAIGWTTSSDYRMEYDRIGGGKGHTS